MNCCEGWTLVAVATTMWVGLRFRLESWAVLYVLLIDFKTLYSLL
jgi:hypothetical protein